MLTLNNQGPLFFFICPADFWENPSPTYPPPMLHHRPRLLSLDPSRKSSVANYLDLATGLDVRKTSGFRTLGWDPLIKIRLMVQKSGITSWYGKYSQNLQGFIHSRSCRISSINCIMVLVTITGKHPKLYWIVYIKTITIVGELNPVKKYAEVKLEPFSPGWRGAFLNKETPT